MDNYIYGSFVLTMIAILCGIEYFQFGYDQRGGKVFLVISIFALIAAILTLIRILLAII